MIKMVVFDFDGTLADTEQWTLEIYNKLAKKYGYQQFTIYELEELKKLPFNKIISMMGVPYTKIFPLLKEGQADLKKHINDVNAFDNDLKNILCDIKHSVETVGIISSNTKKNIRKFCRDKHLSFDFIISSPLFTKEVKIHRVIKKNKIQPQELLYVGDEIRDIEAAKKAQVKMAAAKWGYNAPQMLAEAEPDYLIDDIRDVLSIIKTENV